jgi:hypothetical protein
VYSGFSPVIFSIYRKDEMRFNVLKSPQFTRHPERSIFRIDEGGEEFFDGTWSFREESMKNRITEILGLEYPLLQGAMRRISLGDLAKVLGHERVAQEICRKTGDRAEGMKSLGEKRGPVFKGK